MKALSDYCHPIKGKHIKPTIFKVLGEFIPALGLKVNECAVLGSSWKKEDDEEAGDIDIALPIHVKDRLLEYIKEHNFVVKDMSGIGVVSIAYPGIVGRFAQVDFMLVKDIPYAEWAYYSPSSSESKYKGRCRNLLNFCIANHMYRKYESPTQWTRYWLDNTNGLSWGVQTAVSPKTGKALKKNICLQKTLISNKPKKIIEYLYGNTYEIEDLLTFEQCIEAVMKPSFIHGEKRTAILNEFVSTMKKKGYDIPHFDKY